MFRSTTRMLMIIVACAALVALAALTVAVKAGAQSANPLAWMARDSGPMTQGSKLDPASSTTTPGAAMNMQDTDNDGDNGAESVQDNDQQSEQDQAQEQELSGMVASVDAASAMFTLTTASGSVAIQVTSATQYEDGLSGLASLQSGMSVKVKGTAQAAGQTLATEVKGSSDTNSTDGADTSSPDSGH